MYANETYVTYCTKGNRKGKRRKELLIFIDDITCWLKQNIKSLTIDNSNF